MKYFFNWQGEQKQTRVVLNKEKIMTMESWKNGRMEGWKVGKMEE
jgi:hypothetical protein